MALCELLKIICVTQFVVLVLGDCYLHFPRGCNNRLNEKSANRKDANRMFDSQNNNKGGYNVGDKTDKQAGSNPSLQYAMRYFQSSKGGGKTFLPVEWTNQHACGRNVDSDPIKVSCQVVMQFMCQPDEEVNDSREGPSKTTIRNGVRTGRNRYRAPRSPRNNKVKESSRDARNRMRSVETSKGMHEPPQWRDKCEARPRNKGLFTADQKIKKDQATRTRQNPNGNRNGYECAEERDYYPYWHPSDWKDIAILVEDDSRCDDLTSKSYNVQSYHECIQKFTDGEEAHYSAAETKEKCESNDGEWREFHNYLEKLHKTNGDTPSSKQECESIAQSKGLPRSAVTYGFAIYGQEEECLVNLKKPDCRLANYTRDNHLGNANGDTMQAQQYTWEIPYFPSGEAQRCVFRMRYNISTEDYDPKADASSNDNPEVISNNPNVPIGVNGQTLQLAINTAQTGRTFQDRSHVMLFEPRDDKLGDKDIYCFVVRGKRGNIVQTYPAVEYDFVPNKLEVGTEDLVHPQWTGSNSHNNGNPGGDGQTGDDGEGKGGTDRNNLMEMRDNGKNFFIPLEDEKNMFHNMQVVWAAQDVPGGFSGLDIGMQFVSAGFYRCYDCDQEDSFKAKTQRNKKMDKLLNNAPASYPGMVVSFKKAAEHVCGCTRNNNFSNRSQKCVIKVTEGSKRKR